jgi:hypothetical protein
MGMTVRVAGVTQYIPNILHSADLNVECLDDPNLQGNLPTDGFDRRE